MEKEGFLKKKLNECLYVLSIQLHSSSVVYNHVYWAKALQCMEVKSSELRCICQVKGEGEGKTNTRLRAPHRLYAGQWHKGEKNAKHGFSFDAHKVRGGKNCKSLPIPFSHLLSEKETWLNETWPVLSERFARKPRHVICKFCVFVNVFLILVP